MSKPELLLLPVCSYATGAGWIKIGYATTIDQAVRVIKKHLGDHSKYLLDKVGFELDVFRRTPLAIELNGGPDCFTWNIGK